jgi:hypothetical protein
MATQRLRSVQLPCQHFALVPAYQSGKTEDYKNSLCQKCSGGTSPAPAAKAPKKE